VCRRSKWSKHWYPESKLLLAIDVGNRTLAMAQRVVHHVAQVLAPDCTPLFLTDGFREYMTALLTHYGHWVQPARRQAIGPNPKPRWMPRLGLLYAQVVKTVRKRRLIRVGSCTPSLRLIPAVGKPGNIPSFQHLYEGVLPWCLISFSRLPRI
jgi:hypothetical protein